MTTKTTTKLLSALATAIISLGASMPPAHAGHEFSSLHSEVKSFECLTDQLLSGYIAQLKRSCHWEPCGREKALYDALCELKRHAVSLHEAVECNQDAHQLKRLVCAAREAMTRVHHAAACLHLAHRFAAAENALCSIENSVTRYAHRHHDHGFQHPPRPLHYPAPAPAARRPQPSRDNPGLYRGEREISSRSDMLAHLLSAIFQSRQGSRPYSH